MPHPRFPMPPRRQPALQASQARTGGSDGPLTPDDYDHAAQRLDICSAALRAAAVRWRTSANPQSASTRMRAGLAIYGPVLDALEALQAIAEKGERG